MMRTSKTSVRLLVWIALIFLFATVLFAGGDFSKIDTTKLHSMVVDNAYELEGGREKQFMIIDARTKKEYDKAHIFSSISIPENDFRKSINLLPGNKGVLLIVYCNNDPNNFSQRWAAKAAAAGYSNVLIYKDGFLVWKKKGMPTVSLDGI